MLPDRTTALIIAICFAGVVLVSTYLWGHGNGKESGSAVLAVCQSDRAWLADALNEVNARAATAKWEAEQQQGRAKAAVAGAAEDAQAYEGRIANITKDLENAKRKPTCRAQLEAELCAPLY